MEQNLNLEQIREARPATEPVFSLERAIRRTWFGAQHARPLSLPEQIALSLGIRILSLDLQPGARIIEQEIAEKFQVSRGPIREAFRILEREELVAITARRGCVVAELSAEEVSDIFDVRASLLALIARKFAERKSPASIEILDEMIEALSKNIDVEDDQGQYAETVFEFGLQLVEASGSATLLRIIAPLALRTLRYSLFGLRSSERRRQSIALWRVERNAIANGDVEAASEAAIERTRKSRDEALRLLRAFNRDTNLSRS